MQWRLLNPAIFVEVILYTCAINKFFIYPEAVTSIYYMVENLKSPILVVKCTEKYLSDKI